MQDTSTLEIDAERLAFERGYLHNSRKNKLEYLNSLTGWTRLCAASLKKDDFKTQNEIKKHRFFKRTTYYIGNYGTYSSRKNGRIYIEDNYLQFSYAFIYWNKWIFI